MSHSGLRNPPNKTMLVILDGAGDRSIPEFANRTPYQTAQLPNLDALASRGSTGLMRAIGTGVRPGSDTAHVAIFGYDPYTDYAGRGVYECAGIGADIRPGDVAFRANAGTINSLGIVVDRRAGRVASTSNIADYLGVLEHDGAQFLLTPSLGHRLGLVVRGDGLSANVTDQDPHEIGVKLLEVRPTNQSPEAARTAALLNWFSQEAARRLGEYEPNRALLSAGQLAPNAILFRGAGMLRKDIALFTEKFGLRAIFVAGAPMYKGIAKTHGIPVAEFDPSDGVTGLKDSNLELKFAKALELVCSDDCDMVIVHVKAADTLAEDGNYTAKVMFLEKVDAALKQVLDEPNLLTVITSDHSTSSLHKRHTADPVPILFSGPGGRIDAVTAFDEVSCATGGIGHILGRDVLPLILDHLGVSDLFGA